MTKDTVEISQAGAEKSEKVEPPRELFASLFTASAPKSVPTETFVAQRQADEAGEYKRAVNPPTPGTS